MKRILICIVSSVIIFFKVAIIVFHDILAPVCVHVIDVNHELT